MEKIADPPESRDTPLGLKKEIHLELALRVPNLLAQRRLGGGVQPARRMSEMKSFASAVVCHISTRRFGVLGA
jgi:hypothetical protein